MATDLKNILGQKLPLRLLTDSEQVLDVITHGTRPSKRSLVIDLTVVHNAYNWFEVDRTGLVRGEHNPADGMTRQKHNGLLDKIITATKMTQSRLNGLTESQCSFPTQFITPGKASRTVAKSENMTIYISYIRLCTFHICTRLVYWAIHVVWRAFRL